MDVPLAARARVLRGVAQAVEFIGKREWNRPSLRFEVLEDKVYFFLVRSISRVTGQLSVGLRNILRKLELHLLGHSFRTAVGLSHVSLGSTDCTFQIDLYEDSSEPCLHLKRVVPYANCTSRSGDFRRIYPARCGMDLTRLSAGM